MQEQLLTLKEIYNKYLEKLNHHKVAVRYSDRSWFHSSSAGLCARKHFFSSIQQMEGEPIDDNTRRLFRLGDLVHGDIQDAVRDYADAHGLPILIEKELYLEDLNVRGFIDLALLDRGTLYDIKTCNSWKWTKMFGRAGSGMPDIHQQLQLATYGIWAREEYDVDDLKLVLAYYNKNTSEIKEIELMSNEMMAEAEIYWNGIVDLLEPVDEGTEGIDFTTDTPHMGKLNFIKPKIELGTAPVMKWECNEKYCKYFEVCGGGLKNAG